MHRPLAGKRAWVSGASRGIGRACAMELARLGAEVTVASRDTDALSEVVAALPPPEDGSNRMHRHVQVDFVNPGTLWEAVQHHLKEYGALHVLVNNTGGPPGGPITEATPDNFSTWFSRHLICNHVMAQAVIPGMRAAAYGRIINIVSTSVRQPIRGLGVSNTIRAAVAGWAKTLATELGPDGITVNNVLPGATATDRLTSLIETKAAAAGRTPEEEAAEIRAEIPMGRFGRPDEIAAAVGFLAGPTASYITGVSLPVDGGRINCI
jgi:3-oxoacyl-[acyl-carrier protein] reductase